MLRPSPVADAGLATLSRVDLREVLNGYEVTAVPLPRPRLALVWSESEDVLPDPAGPPARGSRGAHLVLLDDYRITKVPKAS